MTPLGDRRAHVRLEVIGTLRATLEWSEVVRAIDVSTSGLLVESPAPMPPESTQVVSLIVDGQPMIVDARVRRLEQSLGDSSRPAYLIGLEFISPPSELAHWVASLSTDRGQGI